MKKMSITIKAAIIGSIIAGIFVVLGVLLTYKLQTPTANSSPETNDREKAKRIILNYFGYDRDKIEIEKIIWFDFVSKGSNLEFYAVYRNDWRDFVDVFTLRQGFPENLYHRLGNGEGLDANHVTINNKTYFIATSNAGSGSYLTVTLYEYDGIGKPKIAYEDDALFQGKLFVFNNHVYLGGNNQRYELQYGKNSFKRVKYRQRLLYEYGSGSHILAYNIKKGEFQMPHSTSKCNT